MRFLPITFFLMIFFLLTGSNGCKEGCDDVQCAPSPPLLVVTVKDTLRVTVSVPVKDTVTGDTVFVDRVDTITVPTVEATVTLYKLESSLPGTPFGTATPVPSDTSYFYNERSTVPSSEFALIASRGDRADTLYNLTLRHVDGCCGYDIIGTYTVTLPRQ